MARWYQNVLSGEKVEVKTLEADDFYVTNSSNWSRIPAPPQKPATVTSTHSKTTKKE